MFCSTDLLSPSFLLLHFSPSLQVGYTYGFKQLCQKKRLRNLKGWSNCATALSLSDSDMLLSETQLQVSLWLKVQISLFMLVRESSVVTSSLR